jgi:hypothetical protein
MFDAQAHGLPFAATNLGLSRNPSKGLGITVKRCSNAVSNAELLDNGFETYKRTVEYFRLNINWDKIASEHSKILSRILK